MKPFLLLSHRSVDLAADDEYAAMRRFAGLEEAALHRIRMERSSIAGLRLDDWSGVILGGGPFNVTATEKPPVQQRVERELLELMDEVVERDFPLLGACYGIGILGTHQDAVVDRTYAEPVGGLRITLTAAGREDPVFGALPDEFDAFLGHKEAIRELPEHMTVLASSATCPVHAFRIGHNVYATQFHPELDLPGLETRIEVYRHAGYFDPDEADTIRARARSIDVTHPPTILRRFVQRHSR